jgi:ribosomal protein S18 acetylase RimI-like enzyme
MKNIHFRIATNSDIQILLSMMRDLYDFDGLDFYPQKARKALRKIVNDRTLGKVWLILDRSDPIGYVVLTLGYSLEYLGRDAFIDEIFIKESHRRKGIGTEAIRFVLRACNELGVQALHLEVEKANRGARAFYEQIGFENHDRNLLSIKPGK